VEFSDTNLGHLETGDLILSGDAIERFAAGDVTDLQGVGVVIRPVDIGHTSEDAVLVSIMGDGVTFLETAVAEVDGFGMVGVARLANVGDGQTGLLTGASLERPQMAADISVDGPESVEVYESIVDGVRVAIRRGHYGTPNLMARHCPVDGSPRPCGKHDY